MSEYRVDIFIQKTNQITTARFNFEDECMVIAILDEIENLKPFRGNSIVAVKAKNGGKAARFICENGKLIQKGVMGIFYWNSIL